MSEQCPEQITSEAFEELYKNSPQVADEWWPNNTLEIHHLHLTPDGRPLVRVVYLAPDTGRCRDDLALLDPEGRSRTVYQIEDVYPREPGVVRDGNEDEFKRFMQIAQKLAISQQQ